MVFTIRAAAVQDQDVLWEQLLYAARMDEEGITDWNAARTDPFLLPYAAGWGAAGDTGLIAWHGGIAIGACWVRTAETIGHLGAAATADTELAMAVVPAAQGHGIGTTLLACLMALTDAQQRSVGLSVRATNPAQRLYRRMGFVEHSRIVNRVGTESIVMERRPVL